MLALSVCKHGHAPNWQGFILNVPNKKNVYPLNILFFHIPFLLGVYLSVSAISSGWMACHFFFCTYFYLKHN
jgi:hypothetical protein